LWFAMIVVAPLFANAVPYFSARPWPHFLLLITIFVLCLLFSFFHLTLYFILSKYFHLQVFFF
jgi:hypothetical protein